VTEPRFVVTSVTGYSGDGGNPARPATIYQVLDRPHNYALVLETAVKRAAERCAVAMNAGDLNFAHRVERRRLLQWRNKRKYGLVKDITAPYRGRRQR